MNRLLRNPRMRLALLQRFGGKCAICGIDVASGFHADHIVAWSKTKKTNLHGMQPLCRECNLRKGSK